MRQPKIPPELIPEMMTLVGQGKSISEITVWLRQTKGISVTEGAVGKRLKKVKDERAPITAAVVAHETAKFVTADLCAVDAAMQRALDDELRSRAKAWGFSWDEKLKYGLKEGEVAPVQGSEQWQRLMSVVKGSRNDLLQCLELRLKLAGADKDANGKKADPEEVRAKLMSKVDQLLEQATARIAQQSATGGTAAPSTSTLQ